MPEAKLPYVTSYGNIGRALKKIQQASTPPRFTGDFLATKLGMSGGSARPVVPFLKRIGFIASDGTPTELYTQFRGQHSGAAAAKGLRIGYAPLYVVNEYAHELDEKKLQALVVEVTGEPPDAGLVKTITKSFIALNEFADHEATGEEPVGSGAEDAAGGDDGGGGGGGLPNTGLGLNYTINLQLPATSDVAVFDAIFKSLKEHLLP